jgi:hypothetical protein
MMIAECVLACVFFIGKTRDKAGFEIRRAIPQNFLRSQKKIRGKKRSGISFIHIFIYAM